MLKFKIRPASYNISVCVSLSMKSPLCSANLHIWCKATITQFTFIQLDQILPVLIEIVATTPMNEERLLHCQLASHEIPTATMSSTFSPFNSSVALFMVSSTNNFSYFDTMFTMIFRRVASHWLRHIH